MDGALKLTEEDRDDLTTVTILYGLERLRIREFVNFCLSSIY